MEPALYNFSIHRGTTWSRRMTLTSDGDTVDLSSYEARMTIRRTHSSEPPHVELTSDPGGGITLAATSPNIVVTMAAEQTAAMNFARAIYDLEIESPDGTINQLIYGVATLRKEATT